MNDRDRTSTAGKEYLTNKRKLSVVGLLALMAALSPLAIAGLFVGTASNMSAKYTGPARPTDALENDGRFAPHAPPGISAIQPTMPDAVPGAPAFTVQDIVNFINSTRYVGLIEGVDPNNLPTITKIEFLTEREYKARHNNDSNGQPDDTLLCYVELGGSFTLAGPAQAGTEPCSRGFLVFHARTGNQLQYGMGDCGK
ncbi:MAG TPA: hypothetical protein VGE45_04290 [Chloroflexia bacterium]|jgi:hypothetical protein